MIFSSLEYMDEVPFDTVLIHGLVRDAQGRKMSKSLGNGIDPLEIIDKYGADALRFALATGNSPGNDMRFSDEKIEAARNFANKLWNAARFVLMNLTIDKIEEPDKSKLAVEDKWILTKLEECVKSVNTNLDKYELGVALSSIYDFLWDYYCDWYIELTKTSITPKGNESSMSELTKTSVSSEDYIELTKTSVMSKNDDSSMSDRSLTAQNTLAYVLRETLKLLHPFMPFITEEIYSSLPGEEGFIMVKDYPEYREDFTFAAAEEDMNRIIDAIKAIRVRRNEMGVVPSRKAKLFVETKYPETFSGATAFFEKLASAASLEVVEDYADENAVKIITDSATIHIPLGDLVDFEAERARLKKELDTMESEIKRAEGKLSNEGFVSRAPAAVVEAEKAKLEKYKEKRGSIKEAIAKLG